MFKSQFQRVGALAGLLMFFGAWLSAVYDNWLVALIAVVLVLSCFWLALESEGESELKTRVLQGFLVGVAASTLARILGLVTMVWAFDSWSTPVTESYGDVSDFFRIILNGDTTSTALAIIGSGLVGAFVGYAMPYFSADKEDE